MQKYKKAVRLAESALTGDAYLVAEMAVSVLYLGCVILAPPTEMKPYLLAKRVFRAMGTPEEVAAIESLWRHSA